LDTHLQCVLYTYPYDYGVTYGNANIYSDMDTKSHSDLDINIFAIQYSDLDSDLDRDINLHLYPDLFSFLHRHRHGYKHFHSHTNSYAHGYHDSYAHPFDYGYDFAHGKLDPHIYADGDHHLQPHDFPNMDPAIHQYQYTHTLGDAHQDIDLYNFPDIHGDTDPQTAAPAERQLFQPDNPDSRHWRLGRGFRSYDGRCIQYCRRKGAPHCRLECHCRNPLPIYLEWPK